MNITTTKGKTMNIFTATLPNGEKVTRSSKTKTYTHAVIVEAFLNTRTNQLGDEEVGVLNWCGSADLAQKAADKARRGGPSGHWTGVQVIEVN